MKNIKFLFASIALSFLTFQVFGIEVNEVELETVGNEQIVFENYSGPYSVINTAQEISAIGSDLSKEISKNIETKTQVGNSKYSVIHAIDPSEKGKLDADIFIIGASSTIDHIKNIRRILSSYLKDTYSYSQKDADTIAVFITVYNAVYRGNTDYFEQKYKKVVTDNLTSDKCGIALSYKEWPGNTQIVIPLNDINGGLSSIETSVISDKQVVKSMQGEEDKGVESRKEMVDIKEREADNAQEKANEAQKKAVEETEKLQEVKQEASKAEEEAQTAQKEAQEAQKIAEENPTDEEAQKTAEEKQAVAEEKQAEAEQAQKQVEEQTQVTQEAKEEAATSQAVADTKRNEAQTERTKIAQDQQAVIKEQIANENATTVYGLKAVDELGILSELVKMNGDTGKVIKESPVTVIRSRTVFEAGENYIAIAGTNIGNGAVKLVLLDKENMEIIKESAEIVAENSVLVEDNGNYYCVIQNADNFTVAKFDSQLQPLLKSNVPVKNATPITITEKGIMVTSNTNQPILLRLNDLTKISDDSAMYDAK